MLGGGRLLLLSAPPQLVRVAQNRGGRIRAWSVRPGHEEGMWDLMWKYCISVRTIR